MNETEIITEACDTTTTTTTTTTITATNCSCSSSRPKNQQGSFICLCLPLDRTWHKVNDPKVDYSGDLRDGEGRARASARALLVYAGHRPT